MRGKPLSTRIAIFSALLVLHSLAATRFWGELRQLFDGRSFAQRLTDDAFHGLPISEAALSLDAAMPADRPVRLSPELAQDDFALQRITEALYPRPIDPAAIDVVGFTPAHRVVLDSVVLPRLTAAQLADGDSRVALHPVQMLLSFLGALGLGLSLLLAASRLLPSLRSSSPGMIAALSTILGATVVGAAGMLASWLQLPLLAWPLRAVGVALLPFSLAACVATRLIRRPTRAPTPESLGLALLLAAMLVRTLALPISLWDGRSIWLLHAHQLFAHGMMPLGELTRAPLVWSHPDYPLLDSSWLAFFSLGSGLFNERMAAVGIVALWSALLALVWKLSRARLGRWPGAALTFAIFLQLEWCTAGAYVDGLLATSLTIMLLALANDESAPIGWLAALLASNLKAEGLLLALLVAGASALVRRPRRFAGFAVFLPALIHTAWVHASGVDSIREHGTVALGELPARFNAIFAALPVLIEPGYVGVRGLLWDGIAASMLIVAAAARRKLIPGIGTYSAAALLAVCFAFGSIAMLPRDPTWFVNVTLDRLLIHPALLLLLLGLGAEEAS